MFETIIKNRAAVFLLSALVVILGVSAYIALPRENTPEIKQPWIFVTTVYPGVAPADIESLITRPLESAVDGLEGISKITSTSRQSVSSLFVEFDSDTTTEEALRRVKDRVDGARGELPEDAQDPRIKELNSTDWPIFIAVVSHPDGVALIDSQAKVLRDELKRIPGVLDASISGGITREVAVEIDPLKLERYGLSIRDVTGAIQGENASIPGGVLYGAGGNYSIAVTGEIQNPDDFARIMVKDGPVQVALADLGSVSFREARAESFSRINGKPAISIELKKRPGANLIDLAEEAVRRIDKAKPLFARGTEFVVSYDESKFIKETISDLENNMFSGFVLVLIVTIFFLGFRNALFVSLAIPFSMLISFFVLQAMDITLNMIVLFSLIIALGMLVDNGIVAVENIFRHAAMGKSRFRASVDGISEIAVPIFSSTLTTCLAFFPIIFMPGIMGDFMSYLPITIIVVLASSLLVALTINPVFCSVFLGLSDKERRKVTEGSGAFVRVQKLYARIVSAVVGKPSFAILGTVVIVIAGFALYAVIGKEPVFFPASDPATAIINIEARRGAPLERTDDLARLVEKAIPQADTSMDRYQANVGGGDTHKATVRVEFKSYLERDPSGAASTENLKEALKGFTGAKITFQELENGPPSGHPVSYDIVGEDYGVLGSISDQIVSILERYPELKGIQSDYEAAGPELAVSVDRKKAAYLGLSTAQVADAIRAAFNGNKAGTYRDGADEYDIVVSYMEGRRNTIDQLRTLMIPAGEGKRVPLASVAEISVESSTGVIKRKDLRRTVQVYADFKPEVQNKAEVIAALKTTITELTLPAGYRIETGEGVEVQQESTNFLVQAFLIALFLIAVVLIVQFNSLIDPLIIMSSVFLSTGGIFWGYALTGQVFVIIMSGIGCIALAGVVVNNAILLIDYVNQLIKGGMPWREALVESGKTRLRPVFLTALTTVLGMIPMALGVSFDVHTFRFLVGSEQSEFWKSFAWAMIYGLSFATVMTLLIVPALLSVKFSTLDRMKTGRARSVEKPAEAIEVA